MEKAASPYSNGIDGHVVHAGTTPSVQRRLSILLFKNSELMKLPSLGDLTVTAFIQDYCLLGCSASLTL
jgi:hypothetical protein